MKIILEWCSTQVLKIVYSKWFWTNERGKVNHPDYMVKIYMLNEVDPTFRKYILQLIFYLRKMELTISSQLIYSYNNWFDGEKNIWIFSQSVYKIIVSLNLPKEVTSVTAEISEDTKWNSQVNTLDNLTSRPHLFEPSQRLC